MTPGAVSEGADGAVPDTSAPATEVVARPPGAAALAPGSPGPAGSAAAASAGPAASASPVASASPAASAARSVPASPAAPAERRPTSRRARARRRGRTARHPSRLGKGAVPELVGPLPAGPGGAPPGSAAGGRRLTAASVRRRRRAVLVAMGVLTLVGAGLAVGGLSAVRNSTAGRYQVEAGPGEPGYRASVVPTPTMGVLVRGDDGALAGAAVLALAPRDEGGSVVLVPSTVVTRSAAEAAPGAPATLAEVDAAEGSVATSRELARSLTVALDQTVELGPEEWRRLVAPVGGVDVTLDRPLGRWSPGQVLVPAGEVGTFLAARGGGEEELGRVERQQAFWNAWLPRVRDGGETALPGEVDDSLNHFLRVIAAGDGAAATLPVVRQPTDSGVVYRVAERQLGPLVARAIPFPRAPEPGQRIRVRLLDGSGEPGLLPEATRALVAGGAEIDVVGNPNPLRQPRTTLFHRGGARTDRAERLRAVLGGGRLEVVGPDRDDDIDVTVVLGQDAGELLERERTAG